MDPADDDLDRPRSIPLSALEHHAYCARQAALIHVESYFESNVDTVRGDLAHAAVDRGGAGEDRRGQRVWHSLPVWSHALGLHGICDVVRFDADGPTPVEHKSGAYRPGGPADLQVAGQVLCLREMFDAPVPVGVVFSNGDRRRHEVVVDTALEQRVVNTANALRELLDSTDLPAPVHDARCTRCSLRPGCLPEVPAQVLGGLFAPRPLGDWND
ncbi:CRISPR-associated protein Cas4 [Goodfellowiella coeruleoviolacea]|uniref:CRISPR-associated exonuclease Cas4 n=1 Tax=Goodfellowiella coeruleoviolacea TaxID=334858 RepID=A0AAE3GFI5_9PSEU|nr:CRISPR-associated protein Cas4 [Goodfellowiella coeruleoviolacea]MCP2166773.1 CRISPR-associated exonuclease Cas4 [Goodfellowiella coeruleoviolacea]